MQDLIKSQILECLDSIIPADKISGFHIDAKQNVVFSIIVNPAQGTKLEDLRLEAQSRVEKIKGVNSVTAVLTAEKPSVSDPHGMNKNPKLNIAAKHIIAVASGKGGVGKSTVAINLAFALSQAGQSVGILDCDIYGPSIPTLTNLPIQKPEQKDNKLIPFEAYGMKIMSMGFLTEKDAAMIWRGPMVQSAIYQMSRDTKWSDDKGNPLDYLILDMPPGTGDAQLTIAQKIDVTGAIIVSTPQDLSLIDAIKAINMFDKTNVPVLGLIENMGSHICENCGHESHIFGHDTVKDEALKRGLNFLGTIPLSSQIRENADSGTLKESQIFKQIAQNILT